LVFDLILVLIFVFLLWRGWRKGLIRMALNLACLIVALFITFFARDAITNLAMRLPFAERLTERVQEGVDTVTYGIANLPFVSGAIDTVVYSAAFIIMQIIVMVIVFAIATLLLGLLARLLQRLLSIVKLGFLDRSIGLVLGGLKGYIIVYFVTLGAFALSIFWPWLARTMLGSALAGNLINPLALIAMLF